MVVWVSCYAFVPVVVLMVFDKVQTFFKKCCKKKPQPKVNINKLENEEKSELKKQETNEKIKNEKETDNLKEKND